MFRLPRAVHQILGNPLSEKGTCPVVKCTKACSEEPASCALLHAVCAILLPRIYSPEFQCCSCSVPCRIKAIDVVSVPAASNRGLPTYCVLVTMVALVPLPRIPFSQDSAGFRKTLPRVQKPISGSCSAPKNTYILYKKVPLDLSLSAGILLRDLSFSMVLVQGMKNELPLRK